MGERHIRIGNRIFHLVDVPDSVSDELLLERLKLDIMFENKVQIKKIIEQNGVIAS